MKVAIIGGGAAGFFSAIHVKDNHPESQVYIFEKSQKVLSKVKISGGGRCNVTNACSNVSELVKAYPRGGKKLKKAFYRFNTTDTVEWFEKRSVPLVTQEDQCIFPKSQDSQSIIDCFMREVNSKGIKIVLGANVKALKSVDEKWHLTLAKEVFDNPVFDRIIVTTGGSPKRSGLDWLADLGHKIENPVPSLFTFNMPSESVTELMGIVVENALVKIQGTKLKHTGPLLITHWGMSGPAVLVLSAFGARLLEEMNYEFKISVNWINRTNAEEVQSEIKEMADQYPKKMVSNQRPFGIPDRLWQYLLKKLDILPQRIWGELGNKSYNKLTNALTNDVYQVKGKTTFKEEFVTCGGVSLSDIDLNTMQSKVCPNLYFAGEVMDIDAITGGYNFQAAWTTGFIAGELG